MKTIRVSRGIGGSTPRSPAAFVAVVHATAAHLDERQLIEVPMLVGQYHIVSFTLNTLGIQREPGLGGFDNKNQ